MASKNKDFAAGIGAALQAVNKKADVSENGVPYTLFKASEVYMTAQVRGGINMDGVRELAASIEALGKEKKDRYAGLISPIGLGPKDEKGYPVTFGHRRFMAMTEILKWDMVPANVDENARTDLSVLTAVQLAENIQREDLNPVEIALSIASMKEGGKKNTEIQVLLGKNGTYVSKHLKIAGMGFDFLKKCVPLTSDVDVFYKLAQLKELDLVVAEKALEQAIIDGTLTRKQLDDAIEKIKLQKRKEKLPSITAIEAEIAKYYADAPNTPLTFDNLRSMLGVAEDDHELFTAHAYGTYKRLVEVVTVPEVAPVAPVGPEAAPVAPEAPEAAPVAPVTPEAAPVAPEAAPEAPEAAPVAPEVVHSPLTRLPVVKVSFQDGSETVQAELVTDSQKVLGMKAAKGNVFVSVDEAILEMPSSELTICEVMYG